MRKYTLVFVSLTLFFALHGNAQTGRVILLESFTNTGCLPCAQNNPGMDALIAANSGRIAAIKYHVAWPSPTDPMHLHNTSDNVARTNYYGVNSVPHVVIDGNRFNGNSGQITQGVIDQLQDIAPKMDLGLSFEVNETDSTITVNVAGQAMTDLSGDIRLFVGVVENEIHLNTPPGPNGERDFYNVMKKLLPDANGTFIGDLANQDQFSYSFTWKTANVYDINQTGAIAWVQNYITKEVYQACKPSTTSVPSNGSDDPFPDIYPNPTSGLVNIVSREEQTVTFYNIVGQQVYEGTCNGNLQIDTKAFGAGFYTVRVGNTTSKLIVR